MTTKIFHLLAGYLSLEFRNRQMQIHLAQAADVVRRSR